MDRGELNAEMEENKRRRRERKAAEKRVKSHFFSAPMTATVVPVLVLLLSSDGNCSALMRIQKSGAYGVTVNSRNVLSVDLRFFGLRKPLIIDAVEDLRFKNKD